MAGLAPGSACGYVVLCHVMIMSLPLSLEPIDHCWLFVLKETREVSLVDHISI